MVITLLCIFVTIAGAILHYKFEDSCKYYDLDVGGLVCMLLGGLATFIVVVVIIIGHTGVDVSIYKAHMRRESIIKQIECVNSEYEDITRSKVIEKAYNWNKIVYSANYWSKSPLTNWFWSQKYVDSLEYIDLED
jgi:hypothetical protein